MPTSWVGASANAASAAMLGAISPAADISKRPKPRITPSPHTVNVAAAGASSPVVVSLHGLPFHVISAPMACRIPGSRPPGCVVSRGQYGTDTVPPAINAAPRNGAAFDRSGSTITRSGNWTDPGCTRQR